MNRLVLIGNGFDLAHGLKTSYADFINWYWREIGNRLLKEYTNIISDEFCSFTIRPSQYYHTWFQLWSGHYIHKDNPYAPWDPNEVVDIAKSNKNICWFKYESPFFERINTSIETKGWVDIEYEYYSMLIQQKSLGNPYQILNKQLEILRDKMIEYLTVEGEKGTSLIKDINEKIYCPIQKREIAVTHRGFTPTLGHEPLGIMLLNFNYTTTPQRYAEDHPEAIINRIHGRLDKPKSVIFGYGDELDINYSKLKEQNDNECLRHVKSIRYLESDNYRKMLEFIEADAFQVCIMGHSCGNSDRTLLNTLFEHRNCVSIKPYYYLKEDGSDNYIELIMNISRNFTDMKLMRDRVVIKEYTEPLTRPSQQ